ncbi:hypothetical protein L2E82_05739 [Cichorium intybus]|uniref:Uncharacterized protein n=1 Tax=Cichorium intybus TaxID=13427 RepID=A0ACB9H965_CICIN|nr:hypothetical protein L2E82_05739 [Cichorium intybus]
MESVNEESEDLDALEGHARRDVLDDLHLKPSHQSGKSDSVAATANMVQSAVVISQRSGETDDCFIADLAVDFATGQIKAGVPSRGSKVKEKQNQIQTIPVRSTGRT